MKTPPFRFIVLPGAKLSRILKNGKPKVKIEG
jgi:hypothetical protein